jgi:hypothetical protein
VAISDKDFAGALGCSLSSINSYVMAETTSLAIYDQETFMPTQQMKISSQGHNSDLEILYLTASQDDKKIGVSIGRKLIKNGYEITEILIYKKNESSGKFEIEKLRDYDIPNTCKNF